MFVGTFFGHYEKSCQSTSCLKNSTCLNLFTEEYGQYYGQMNTMNPHTMRTMKQQHEGLPYEEMGYCPPPNRKLPPVPGQHSNYNTIDRIKNGKLVRSD